MKPFRHEDEPREHEEFGQMRARWQILMRLVLNWVYRDHPFIDSPFILLLLALHERDRRTGYRASNDPEAFFDDERKPEPEPPVTDDDYVNAVLNGTFGVRIHEQMKRAEAVRRAAEKDAHEDATAPPPG